MSFASSLDSTSRPAVRRSDPVVLVALLALAVLAAWPVDASERTENTNVFAATTRVQTAVDDLRARLSIPSAVTAAIVPDNPLKVSVEPDRGRPGAFTISFEGGFLATLSEEDLRAVVAHELGHVWIFTHHPYLQTEELANEVALRVVSRATLEHVYDKIWADGAPRGTVARFPDEPASLARPTLR